jgi:MYXO-CTERM domain-containing protein
MHLLHFGQSISRAAAVLMLGCASLPLAGQVFTDLRDTGFISFGGVISAADGPVIFGNIGKSDTNPVAAWSRSAGLQTLNLPVLSPIEFKVESVSANGSVLAGRGSGSGEDRFRPSAYRWSEPSGYQEFTNNIRDTTFRVPNRVSADGSVVIGFGASAGFRWEQSTGAVDIGARLNDVDVISSENPLFFASDLSRDGSVIVGYNTVHPLAPGQAARWTAETGAVGLGELFPFQPGQFSEAVAVSGNGSIIAGTGHYDPEQSTYSEAFRWTEATGMVSLVNQPGGMESFATAMSDDGSLIVGGLGSIHTAFNSDPFIWTPGSGMQRLVDVLTEQYGIGNELTGWNLGRVLGLSRDGRYILGTGTGPDDRQGAWLVDLGMTPIPEPETYGAIAALGLIALAAYRRRRSRIGVACADSR